MSNLYESKDRDITSGQSYDLDNKTQLKKQMDELNTHIIEEFRSSGGKVQFSGANILLLHTLGAKSHQPRVNPVGYMRDGDAFIIIASKGGALTNPDWYYNILAHPDVWLEVGTERFQAHATIPEREERDRLFANFEKEQPGIAERIKNTPRILPVIVLKRI